MGAITFDDPLERSAVVATDGGRHLRYQQIARTNDTDDPVMRATLTGTGSWASLILRHKADPQEIRVAHVVSEREGDMAVILDDVVKQTGITRMLFLSPLDKLRGDDQKKLIERLDGFNETTEKVLHRGEPMEVEMYVGQWEPEREA